MLKKPFWLALWTLVGMYSATTGLGAALFATEFGRNEFQLFMGPDPIPFDWMTTLGSPLYWTLLLSLIVIAPVAALISARSASLLLPTPTAVEIPTWIPIAMSVVMVGWCIYKLAMADALSLHDLLDPSVPYSQKMERRAELIGLLGNRYYAFAYSSLPVLTLFLLSKSILQKDRLAAAAFWILSIVLFWLYLAMIMKAPIIIYLGLVTLTMILCRRGVIRTLSLTVPGTIVIYLALSQIVAGPTTSPDASNPSPTTSPGASNPSPTTSPDASNPSAPIGAQKLVTSSVIGDRVLHFARAAILRMASSFPYYVQAFADPNERCGLETPQPLRFLPQRTCFAPIKVFRLMYPKITYVTGYAPAPANISAYAELGLTYTFVATMFCGAVIGLLTFFAQGEGPVSLLLGVVACTYAYYVSQVSLIGSIVDSYGLLWMLLPIGLMVALSSLFKPRNDSLRRNEPVA
jgi:hypothetical protein